MRCMESIVTSLIILVASFAFIVGSSWPSGSRTAHGFAGGPKVTIPVCGGVQVVVRLGSLRGQLE